MQFQINTPQTMGAHFAKQESRRASKRKSAHGSNIEPSSKKQKVVHSAQPLAPAQPPASATTFMGSTQETLNLVNASPHPAGTQASKATDLGPVTKKRKSEYHSEDPDQGRHMAILRLTTQEPELVHGSSFPVYTSLPAEVHDTTDLGPASKKQQLSYDNLPPARVRKRASSEESARRDVECTRRLFESRCRRNGYDYQVLSKLPDRILMAPGFDLQKYMLNRGSIDLAAYGAPKTAFPTHAPSAEELRAELPKLDTNHLSDQKFHGPSYHSPPHSAAVSLSSDRAMSHMSYDTRTVRSDKTAPLSPGFDLRDDTTQASSPQTPSVCSVRNRGGRPRTKKPRVFKPVKGPMRFQKNHPVRGAVNVDVWENILLFCPPAFLLKARTISSTFRSMLKDDSLLWKISRVNHFSSDMPEPPLGISEPQYADLLTGTGCQTRGCQAAKTRKPYWVFQKRLCNKCFQKAFLPPRALQRVFKELETSETPQYRLIAQYYQNMEDFLPGMKFDRRDNYQWLGDYDPAPSWGKRYRSGQYVAFPASAYANFSSELAAFVGNDYDEEQGRFTSKEPMPGKTCPPQDAIDAWFDAKRAANDALVPVLKQVEDWHESYKRRIQEASKDVRESRAKFFKQQAEKAGLDRTVLEDWTLEEIPSYQAAIAIAKPPTVQSWNILRPKLMEELNALKQYRAVRELREEVVAMEREEKQLGGWDMAWEAIQWRQGVLPSDFEHVPFMDDDDEFLDDELPEEEQSLSYS